MNLVTVDASGSRKDEYKAGSRASKMAKWVKGLAVEPDGLSQNPHGGKRKTIPTSCPLIFTHVLWYAHVGVQTHTHAHTT